MAQIFGGVECSVGCEWFEVIRISSLLMQHYDFNGCLFGVDNYAGFEPLFAERGLPKNCSPTLVEQYEACLPEVWAATWVGLDELLVVDWEEYALRHDERISEYQINHAGARTFVTKWLHRVELDDVERELVENPASEVCRGSRVYLRAILKRADAVVDTDFELLLQLMKTLAGRFGVPNVRVSVWFG